MYDFQIFNRMEYGGISRYFYELTKYLSAKQICEVKIIAPIYINKYINNLNHDIVFGKCFQNIKRTHIIRRYINTLITKMLLTRLNPDIIHETYYDFIKLSHRKPKIVTTLHDMIHEKYGQYFSPKDNTAFTKSKALNRADHIICVSENTRKDLIELTNIHPSKTSVVYHGSSITKNEGAAAGKVFSRPYILWVGGYRHLAYKNFQRLVQAYATSKRLARDFDLVCFGGNEFSSDELALINRFGLTSNKVIQINGSDEALSNLYSNAAAFIFPSLYEGFGIPLLEAMSCQCPIVCSNTSSMPEVAENAAEYFDPYLVDNIIEAMENVVYSVEKSNDLISRGLVRIKYFSWEKCAQQTYAIYSSLL